MKNDAYIIEAYIDFINNSMRDLIRITERETERLKKINILNRKKNIAIIKQEYQQYAVRINGEWGKIYKSPDHFSETLKHKGLLERGKTLYAITLNQRQIEQFYYHMLLAVSFYTSIFDNKTLAKMTKSDMFNNISFSLVRIAMERNFITVMQTIKDHSINVDDKKKMKFVEMNQKLLPELYIKYQAGEVLSDARIDRLLMDITEEKDKKSKKFEEGVKSGDIRVSYASYETREEIETALENESCTILSNAIGGSSANYKSLPELPMTNDSDLLEIMTNIDLQAQREFEDAKKKFEIKEINAFYLGLVTGYSLLRSTLITSSFLKEKFLQNNMSTMDVPENTLDYIDIARDSVEAKKIEKVKSLLLGHMSTLVMYPSLRSSNNSLICADSAVKIAYKMGYHAYLRLFNALPGNTAEEDLIILKRLCSKGGKPGNNTTVKQAIKVIENSTFKESDAVKKEVVSYSEGKKKYWVDNSGKVRCPGVDCPIDCNLACPIYAQTIALQKLIRNEFEEAAKLLEKAVMIEPMFADAWNNLAACYGQMGKHKNAYAAYLKAYEIEQKPSPLFGIAVATKNMKEYSLAMKYAKEYASKYGSDEKIKSLIAEISENELLEKIEEDPSLSEKQEEKGMVDTPKHIHTQPEMKKEILQKIEPEVSVDSNSELLLDDMHKYGKVFLQLMKPETREAGYAEMEKLERTYPEAGVVLGQYYNGNDISKAKKHFKRAADAGIAEGQWGYACIIPHSDIPDDTDIMDKEWVKYCLAAAEGGCVDAANEMGNICHRKGFYEEATYWYGMAYELGHPSGINSLQGITKEWRQKGIAKNMRAYTESFTMSRHTTSMLILELFSRSAIESTLDDLMRQALDGENLAGFMLAEIFEKNKHDDMAYKVYNALAFENHPHALRCYADMLLAGKGTNRDIEAAFRFYEQAAMKGNETSMFAMGQKAVKAGDKYLAACWFGQAYSRGMKMAGEWLSKLA